MRYLLTVSCVILVGCASAGAPSSTSLVAEVTSVTIDKELRVELRLDNHTGRKLFFFDPSLSTVVLDPKHCAIRVTDDHAVLRRPMHFTPGFVPLEPGAGQSFHRELDLKEFSGWECAHIDVSAELAFLDEEQMSGFPPGGDQEGVDFAIRSERLVRTGTRRIELHGAR